MKDKKKSGKGAHREGGASSRDTGTGTGTGGKYQPTPVAAISNVHALHNLHASGAAKVNVSDLDEARLIKFLCLLDLQQLDDQEKEEGCNPELASKWLTTLSLQSNGAGRNNSSDSGGDSDSGDGSSHCGDSHSQSHGHSESDLPPQNAALQKASKTEDNDDDDDSDDTGNNGNDDLRGFPTSLQRKVESIESIDTLTPAQLKKIAQKYVRDDRRMLRAAGFTSKASENRKFLNSQFPSSHAARLMGLHDKENAFGVPSASTGSIDGTSIRHHSAIVHKDDCTAMGPTVRVQLCCGGGISKLIVLKRTMPISEVLLLSRKKLKAALKYSFIIVQPEGILLTASELMRLPNDSILVLSQTDPSVTSKELVPTENAVVDASIDSDVPTVMGAMISMKSGDGSNREANSDGNYGSEAQHQNDRDRENIEHSQTEPHILASWKPPNVFTFEPWTAAVRSTNAALSASLKHAQEALFGSEEFATMATVRQALPIYHTRKELLTTIANNPIVVVSGETGSGKSTQLPAYLLEDMIDRGVGSEAYIIVTQPRRIAAISVAERVAQERLERVGNTVGYQVRLHSSYGKNTRILYCTTGVLLRRLQQADFLNQVSHIIVDEVHERQVETDFLMTILRQRIPAFSHLKLILMSATLQESTIIEYFRSPVVYVQGRTHPVEHHFMEDTLEMIAAGNKSKSKGPRGRKHPAGSLSPPMHAGGHSIAYFKSPQFYDTVADCIMGIIRKYSSPVSSPSPSLSPSVGAMACAATSGLPENHNPAAVGTGDAILVFLSGMDAIKKVEVSLRNRGLMGNRNVNLHILHGSLPPEQQRKVFRRTKPGEWKVVLSTNIAETSVTVEDVTHVVDTGMVKELRYDPIANMSSLQEVVVSRASTRQRAGRAGRVRPGHSWRLYTEAFINGPTVPDFPIPEIRRVPLEEVILQVLLLELGLPEEFLGQCLDPPSMPQIRSSVGLLLEVKAILPQAQLPLTPLGYHLARLPIDVRVGKMLIISCLLGCIEPVLTIAATLSAKSPFVNPPDKLDEASKAHRHFIKHTTTAASTTRGSEDCDHDLDVKYYSDHLAAVNAFDQWRTVASFGDREGTGKFLRRNYLSGTNLEEIRALREQFRGHLVEAGFIRRSCGDIDNENDTGTGTDNGNAEAISGVATIASTTFASASSSGATDQSRSRSMEMVLACLCAGLAPNIAKVARFADKGFEFRPGKGKGARHLLPTRVIQSDGIEVFVHPSSVLHKRLSETLEAHGNRHAFLCFHKKVATSKVYLHDCSAVPPLGVLLFGGDIAVDKHSKGKERKGVVTVGGWMSFKLSELHAVLFKRLQGEIDLLLTAKVEDPTRDLTHRQAVLIGIIEALLLAETDS